jgi:hypothetical protein
MRTPKSLQVQDHEGTLLSGCHKIHKGVDSIHRSPLMLRIDLSYFYKTGELIHQLTQLSGEKTSGEMFGESWFAYEHLRTMISSGSLISSYASAVKLKELLEPYTDVTQGRKEKIPFWEVDMLARQAQTFETTLNAELAVSPTYTITPKGGYHIDILLRAPSQMFPPGLVAVIPETAYDVEQSAKCLAFEVSTAAGFHLHRLNESVVHRYWDAASKGKERPNNDSVGEYLVAMDAAKIGDEKIKSTLRQINKLHRNPVLHPEDNLTVQQAIELFGIIVSAISAMLPVIKKYLADKSKASVEDEDEFSEPKLAETGT